MHYISIKQLHTEWLRASAVFTTIHQQLEEEILRMRERKVSQEIIDKKDLQVESLVNFFNQTDELIQAQRLALANAKIENHCLTEMVAQKISLIELMNYKPSLKLLIVNDETAEAKTLSQLNG